MQKSDNYILNWDPKINSGTNAKDSYQSNEIKETGFALKFYKNKGGQTNINSLGVVKSSFFGHFAEDSIEKMERTIYGEKQITILSMICTLKTQNYYYKN